MSGLFSTSDLLTSKTSPQFAEHSRSPEPSSFDEDGDRQAVEADGIASRPLAWVMSRMSYMARKILISRPSPNDDRDETVLYSTDMDKILSLTFQTSWSLAVIAILRFFGGVYELFSAEQVKRYLRHGITPIFRILEDAEGNKSADQDERLGMSQRVSPADSKKPCISSLCKSGI